MENSKRIDSITTKSFTPLMIDSVLGTNTLTRRMLKDMPKVEYTWRQRLWFKVRPVVWYFQFLWEAITNSHRCDTNDWD